MTVYSDTVTVPFSVTLLLSTIFSTLLNPLVFRHNYYKHPSVPRTLFLVLTLCDFLTCLVIPANFIVGAVAIPRDMEQCVMLMGSPERCESSYFMFFRPADVGEKVVTVLMMTMSYLPGVLTGLMALSRLYAFTYAFKTINLKMVKGLVVAITLYMATCFACVVAPPDAMWFAYSQQVWNFRPFWGMLPSVEGYILCTIPCIILQILAIVASVMTVNLLMRKAKSPMTAEGQRNFIRGTVVMLATNLGSTVFLMTFFAMLIMYATIKHFTFATAISNNIYSTLCPCVLSAVNPAIYVLFTDNVLTRPPTPGTVCRKSAQCAVNRLSAGDKTTTAGGKAIAKDIGHVDAAL